MESLERPTVEPAAESFDLIIRSGNVVDGTGRAAFKADIGISGGRIRAIGDLGVASAADGIDASGLTVTPGFIDIHSHSDFTLLVDGRAQSALAQGVTTELVGNCGHGCAPMRQENPAFAANIFGYESVTPLDWRSTSDYLERLEGSRPAINVAALVPLGNLRLAAMDNPEKVSSGDERREMLGLLEEGLDAGAFGMSTGLEYADSVETQFDELAELAGSVAQRGGLYASHYRHYDERSAEGITEAIEVGRASGARVQLSHAMPQPGAPDGMLDTTFELVEAARRNGIDTAVDMVTRTFGELNLSAALPVWAVDGGPEEIRGRLLDPATREQIRAYQGFMNRFLRAPGPEKMTVDRVRDESLLGRSLSELTPAGGDPIDVVLDILVDEVEDVHVPLLLIEMYSEDDLARFYQHPLCAVTSDATTLSPDGVLGHAIFHGAYTWAAWFLRRIVRERGALPLEEAIRHLTELPAERMGLVDRGLLRDGAWADIAVFDPTRVAERGTLKAPSQLAVGVEHVIVNGSIAFRAGRPIDSRAGSVLRFGI